MSRKAIVWFRQDLRIHDNEALLTALRMADEVIPVYVFDERVVSGSSSFGFRKMGKFRAQFMLESVIDLRKNLQELGSNLVVQIGKPEEIIYNLAHKHKVSWVFCNRERTQEEVFVQDVLEKCLWTIGAELMFTRGKMLFHTQDLPVPVTHTADFFTQFRKDTELITPIREPLPRPEKLPPLTTETSIGNIPTLQDFGHVPFTRDNRAALHFQGGETAALARLKYYLWDSNFVATYKQTRNGMVGGDYSTKFSPWLSTGCLSPKMVYYEVQRYERERTCNESTYWIFFELLWRDYFRLMGKKHGNKIFKQSGPQGKDMSHLKNDHVLMQKWINGTTGVPFVDANMRELAETGFMSNRGRQNVSSFLVKDLKINWLMGAEYFESMLLDYDPCSNYGNWNYVAGVGSDPREDRYFNQMTQARNYDSHGDFVRLWCPELRLVPAEKIHRPDLLSATERKAFKVGNYPDSMVDMNRWG